jgi:hypothetical protein
VLREGVSNLQRREGDLDAQVRQLQTSLRRLAEDPEAYPHHHLPLFSSFWDFSRVCVLDSIPRAST